MRLIDIEPYEKDGWYLQKISHNEYGESVKVMPLATIPTAEAEPSGMVVFREGDKLMHIDQDALVELWRMVQRGELTEPKHGRWIVISEYPKKAECSYCGYPIEHELVCWWDYCPNCGARKDEVGE